MAHRRIAVLGGGMGALAAAYALSGPDNPRRDELEITVYQMGWRLGGKGASGRSLRPGHRGRIEEHGLHNLFGFYENTFRMMRACYRELGRAPEHPLATFRDAVRPESSAIFMEPLPGGGAAPWRITNPVNRHVPGEGDLDLPLWSAVVMAVEFVDLNFVSPPDRPPHPSDGALHPRPGLLPLASAIMAAAWGAKAGHRLGRRALGRLDARLAGLIRRGGWAAVQRAAVQALRLGRAAAWRGYRGRLGSHSARRQWILLNFSTSVLIGMLEDGVFHRGYDAINDRDFRDWLTPRALDDGGVMLDSVLMRVVYDSSFAYEDGDTRVDSRGHAPKANYEAGTLLRGLVRASTQYKGAFGWKLQGGCGDVLIAPLYEVLRARGVRFRFFHQVTALRCGQHASDPIQAVELCAQTPIIGGAGAYEPLVDFGGVPCWPAEPRYEQLVHGAQIAQEGIDLERAGPPAPGAQRLTLRRGVDFDAVVLGIAVGALPALTRELAAASTDWADMLRHLKTTPTQALQVWSGADSRTLGADAEGGQPITGFWYDEASALNVWADMSHLVPWEGRPEIQHVSYFVSPMRDAGGQRASDDKVDADARALMADHVSAVLWPAAAQPGGGLDWSVLADPDQRAGEARMAAQYTRANVEPTERYVLSVAGSSRYRLPASDPARFPNLFLAGDWTLNGLNCGCMEAAVTSGLLAASALGEMPLEMVRYA